MKTKLKICSVCGDPCVLWVSNPKMCKNCAGRAKAEQERQQSLTQTKDGQPAKLFKYQTSIIRKAKSLTVDQINEKVALNNFFDGQGRQVPERCENCNLKLNAFSSSAKRCVTAHILPKNDNDFPSVAVHPDNRMFLGFGLFSDCNCHDLWDKRDAAARKTMHCYGLALLRVEGFIDQLTPHELVKFEKYFGLEVKAV